MSRHAGLDWFRCLFLIEDLITIVCAPFVIFGLPDWPAVSKWLGEDEKAFVTSQLEAQFSAFTRERSSDERSWKNASLSV
jgi:hypothetical protein